MLLKFRLLTGLSVVFIIFAVFSFWVSNNLYNTTSFTETTLKTFKSDEVRGVVAKESVERILENRPVVRQVAGGYLESFIAGVLGSDTAKGVFERSSNALHGYLFSSNRQDVTLNTTSFTSLVKPVLTAVSPDLAGQVPEELPESIVLIESNALPNIDQWLRPVIIAGPLVGLAALIIVIYLIYADSSRIKAIKRLGLYLAVGSLLSTLTIPYFRMLIGAASQNQNRITIITTAYDNFTKPLLSDWLLLALAGVLIYLVGLFWPKIVQGSRVIKKK